VWFAPILGVCLYWAFGINRIKRRARLLFAKRGTQELPEQAFAVAPQELAGTLPAELGHLVNLAELTERITRQPLMAGNRITAMIDGDQAYPQMLSALEAAQQSVSLSTYIFDNDRWGRRFRASLRSAVVRGVSVRVLVDAVGARYSFPPIVWGLRRDRVPVASFMRSLTPWGFRYLNLRTHRKILVVDGRIGFTGGMNIRQGNVLADRPRAPIRDLHFQVEGPVVSELQGAFADDWRFTTGEVLAGPAWFPPLAPVGDAVARGIADGPDEDFDKLRLTLLGALACAQRSIRVVTPYFLPDPEIETSLRVAALRGVDVRILLPEKNNLRMVGWASWAGIGPLLDSGCRVCLSPPPFDHSKLMVVDDAWTLFGSANWDPRSLVLNFEFNVECYDSALASEATNWFDQRASQGIEIRAEGLARRPALVRIRDRAFRLFSPYL
jgi:cardiolipin synthase